MKNYLGLALFIVTAISYAGPVDAESIGLSPSGFVEVSDSNHEHIYKESIALVSAFVPRDIRSSYKEAMEPVGWFDKQKILVQIRCGGGLPAPLFKQCLKKGKWKSIKTPKHYLDALHMPADAVTCFDGELDGCATHIVWIEMGNSFMIVSELKKLKP